MSRLGTHKMDHDCKSQKAPTCSTGLFGNKQQNPAPVQMATIPETNIAPEN